MQLHICSPYTRLWQRSGYMQVQVTCLQRPTCVNRESQIYTSSHRVLRYMSMARLPMPWLRASPDRQRPLTMYAKRAPVVHQWGFQHLSPSWLYGMMVKWKYDDSEWKYAFFLKAASYCLNKCWLMTQFTNKMSIMRISYSSQATSLICKVMWHWVAIRPAELRWCRMSLTLHGRYGYDVDAPREAKWMVFQYTWWNPRKCLVKC